jgi:hypothetical protein
LVVHIVAALVGREAFRQFVGVARDAKVRGDRSSRIATDTIALIRRMTLANRVWGAERIRGELL